MKLLKLTRLGNPVLRQIARRLTEDEIKSHEIQELISDIRHTNETKKYGVGLAAPQVGESVALSVIGIKPTPTRPELEPFDQVIINPKYTGVGRRQGMYEGCQSIGGGRNIIFGKALRYGCIKAEWYDENAKFHKRELDGFVAHVFQHETDHLNGIVFLDKVKNRMSFMMADEYSKLKRRQK